MARDTASIAPKRVLVIAYYFPPMGLSGVQRIARFVKYLPDNGWTPTVLTVRPRGYFAFDATLEDEIDEREIEIIRTASVDPTRILGPRRRGGLPDESRRKSRSELRQWGLCTECKIRCRPCV